MPSINTGEIMDWLRWIFLLGCVLPLVVMLVLGVLAYIFGRRWVEEFVEPDVDKLHSKLVTLRAKSPNISQQQLVRNVIHEQALKCGVIGAVTGFGGFFTMPIGLPIDIMLSVRYQASMVSFIAQVYGYNNTVENKAATYAVMTGGTQLSQVTAGMLTKYIPRFVGKLSSKLIPIAGALVSFAVNYAIARSVGMLAARWYENKPKAEVLSMGDNSAVTA
jgi:hypothetical protein